eukprot:GEMP01000888.1.p1 GENE.GEMP01000888.1~~GEMP01000888.1.p1  ORF type:complete len:1192 (+),score=238.88 GEMP01000888.1:87-3662(+)
MSGPPSPQLPLVVQAKNAMDDEGADDEKKIPCARYMSCPSDMFLDDFGITSVPDEGDSPTDGCLIRAPRSQSTPTPGTIFTDHKVPTGVSRGALHIKFATEASEKSHSSGQRREGSSRSAPDALSLRRGSEDSELSATPKRPTISSMPAMIRASGGAVGPSIPLVQGETRTGDVPSTSSQSHDCDIPLTPDYASWAHSTATSGRGFPFSFGNAFSARAPAFTNTEESTTEANTSPSIIQRLFGPSPSDQSGEDQGTRVHHWFSALRSEHAKSVSDFDDDKSPQSDDTRRRSICAISPSVPDDKVLPALSTAAQFFSAFLPGSSTVPKVEAAAEPVLDTTKNIVIARLESPRKPHETMTIPRRVSRSDGGSPSSSSTSSPRNVAPQIFVSSNTATASFTSASTGGDSPHSCASVTEVSASAHSPQPTDRSPISEQCDTGSPTTAGTRSQKGAVLHPPIPMLHEFYTPEIAHAMASELVARLGRTDDPTESFQIFLSEIGEESCVSPSESHPSSPLRRLSTHHAEKRPTSTPPSLESSPNSGRAAQRATSTFQAQVRQIMKSGSTKFREIDVLLSGVLWKEERPKSMKSALGKMWDSTHWASNMKKTVATTVKEAWQRKSDDQPAKMSLRTVELCRVHVNDGEPVAYLRWARIEQTTEPITTETTETLPAPESLATLEERLINVKERPLLGSWVVDDGVRESGLHVMHIYFPWGTENSARAYPFATKDAEQFREWFDALRAAGKCPEPTPEQYKLGIVSAKLNLEIISAAHGSSEQQYGGSPTDASTSTGANMSTFCVVTFKGVCMRTPCVDSVMNDHGEEVSYWDHKTEIVIERDEPDDSLTVEAYTAPNVADSHATLVGKTNIPLWFFERQRHVELSLTLKNPDQLRRGVVSKTPPVTVSIRGFFDQPLRSVFMPLELPSRLTEEPADINVVELQETIQRIEALIKIYNNLIELVKYMLFWDSKAYSAAWLTLITVWFLWIPEYTLTILLILISFFTVKYHWGHKAREFGGKVFMEDTDERHRWTYFRLNPVPRRSNSNSDSSTRSQTEKHEEDEVPKMKEPDRLIYEHERRWPFTQFDPQYLFTDIDQPHYMDKATKLSTQAPKSVMIDRDGVYNYRWEVNTTTQTDENGWQYAVNASSTQWRSLYNSFDCFFRRRLHIGYRLHKNDPELDNDEEADDLGRPSVLKSNGQ